MNLIFLVEINDFSNFVGNKSHYFFQSSLNSLNYKEINTNLNEIFNYFIY